jgi:hypothetical protein
MTHAKIRKKVLYSSYVLVVVFNHVHKILTFFERNKFCERI